MIWDGSCLCIWQTASVNEADELRGLDFSLPNKILTFQIGKLVNKTPVSFKEHQSMRERGYLINLMYLEFVKYFKIKKGKHFDLHVSLFLFLHCIDSSLAAFID